jgi:hypothetical protein
MQAVLPRLHSTQSMDICMHIATLPLYSIPFDACVP